MTAADCAALVERGDPLRWRTAMAAPPGGPRDGLMALYAFNLEIARAGFAASEPLLGQIRLRWWAEAIEEAFSGDPPRRHEVTAPLAAAIRASGLPRAPFDAMIAAREWDCHREGFADHAACDAYLEATGGGLMWLAARHLGAPPGAEPVARAAGRATAAASFLRAAARLAALGRRPLADRAAAARIAASGLGWLAEARAGRAASPAPALPALLPAALAGPVLRAAARRPEAAAAGDLEPSEFSTRARLALAAMTGRW